VTDLATNELGTSELLAGVDAELERCRMGVRRLHPAEAWHAAQQGALLIDTRTETQRGEQGELPGSIVIDRTILEWRLDPSSEWRIPEAVDVGVLAIVVCRQGYSSSLAAASLRRIGLHRATDVVGGFEAWCEAGLPLADPAVNPPDIRR
jgi:rhodanese-related sulfurtransferase